MTIVNIQRTTGNIEQGRRVTDAEAKIALLDPQVTPLMTAFGTYGREYAHKGNNSVEVTGTPLMKRETYNPEYTWWEDAVQDRTDQLDGAITNVQTAITVDDGTVFFAGAEVFIPSTGEIIIVDSVAGNVLTVRRGIGTTAAAAADNAVLIVLGSVYPEGVLSRDSISTLETKQFNYTQIFRTPFAVTRTLDKSKLWTEDQWTYQMRKQGIEHLKSIERAFWFGARSEQTNSVSGTPERTTGGILKRITTNVTSAGGTLTEAEWESFLETAFTSGSTRKYAFASPRALSVINAFGTNKLRLMTPGEKVPYGLSVYEYQSAHGVVHLVRTPLFTEVSSSVVSVVVLDMEQVKYRYLTDSDTKVLEDIQENDRDGRKGEYITECGIQVMLEQNHSVLTNVDA